MGKSYILLFLFFELISNVKKTILHTEVLETIENNTDSDSFHNGNKVMNRKRTFKNPKLIFLYNDFGVQRDFNLHKKTRLNTISVRVFKNLVLFKSTKINFFHKNPIAKNRIYLYFFSKFLIGGFSIIIFYFIQNFMWNFSVI